jgi:hypothetical protein
MNMGRGRFSEHDNEYDSEDFADFGEISTPMKWLIALGAIGVSAWYFMSRASAQDATAATANLELSVTFLGTRAPGSEKLKAIGRLLKGIMGNEKFTLASGTVIDGCPMAPKNVEIVKREAPVSHSIEGRDARVVLWRVHADFGADFDSENPYLRDEVSACIFKILQNVASVESVPIVGFRGKRVAQ